MTGIMQVCKCLAFEPHRLGAGPEVGFPLDDNYLLAASPGRRDDSCFNGGEAVFLRMVSVVVLSLLKTPLPRKKSRKSTHLKAGRR